MDRRGPLVACSILTFSRCTMAHASAVFLLCVASALTDAQGVPESCRGTRCSSGQDWSPSCVGAHCQRRTEAASRRQLHHSAQSRQGQVHPGFQRDAHFGHHQAQSAPAAPYTITQPQPGGFTQRVGTDGMRTNPRTITAEVFHPGCAGGTCTTAVSRHPTSDDSGTRECKGLGCKLPVRMRQKPKPCVGDGCGAHGGADARGNPSPVHVTDRAAQFLEELPDLGSQRGAWIQMTCDMKSGRYGGKKDLIQAAAASVRSSRLVKLSFVFGCNRDQRCALRGRSRAAAAAIQGPGEDGRGPQRPTGRGQGTTEAPERAAGDVGHPAERDTGAAEEDV